MAITQNHVINIQPGVSAPLVIHCSQGDTGTQINLTVVNGDEEFDCSSYACSVHGVRSDGGNWGPITCTVSGSTVCFSLTSAMTAVAGACLAEISVGTVGTANFAMLMENATFENGVTYSNDVSVYQNILNAVQAGLSLAEAAVANEKDERIAAVNAEASARASADSNLQSQINQIVAPSGEAPSAAEVQNARMGADGVTYDTLGTAIRTQASSLKEDIVKVNKNLIPNEIIFKGKSKFTGGWETDLIASDITFYHGHPWDITINLHSDVVDSSYVQVKDQSGNVVWYWQLKDLKAGKHKMLCALPTTCPHSNVYITSDKYVDTCDFEISNNYINNIEKLSREVNSLQTNEHKFDYTKFILGITYNKYAYTSEEAQNEELFIFDQDILIKVNDGFTFCVTGFNSDGTYTGYYSGWKTGNESLVVEKNTYFRIGIDKVPVAKITSIEEIKEYVNSVTYNLLGYTNDISNLKNDINDTKNDISNLNTTLSTSIQNKISNKMMLNIIQNDIYYSHLDVDYYDGLIIPSQSIYDVMRSKTRF